jgi:hypothetical protein
MRSLGVILLVWAAAVADSSARDLFVDNVGGDDRFDGAAATTLGGRSGPCRTITNALRKAHKGDRIIVAPTGRPYYESITLQSGRHSGIAGQSFEIIGNGAVLDGTAPVPRLAWKHVNNGIFCFAPPRTSYQMFFLDNVPPRRVPVERGAISLPELKPLEWCLFERKIYFRPERGRLPDSYDVRYAALTVGITLYEVRNVVIRDVIVQGFQLDGINSHDGVSDTVLRNVTCRGNARSGISIGGASRVRIENCLAGDNGTAQIRTEGYSHTQIVDCELLDNSAPAIHREGGEVHTETTGKQAPAAASADGPRSDSGAALSLAERTAFSP